MSASPLLHRFKHDAMATSFEIVISAHDADQLYAGQAAHALFAEIDRLEDELSRFRAGSDIFHLSQLKAGDSANVGLATWDCLTLAKSVYEETDRAFDITIGPLMGLWRTPAGDPRQPPADELAYAHTIVGSHLFTLDEDGLEVTVHASPMVFDLGAIGKGYALDMCADLLREWSISNALLNAGDSTVLALGNESTGSTGWSVTIGPDDNKQTLQLQDLAVSGSGFAVQGAHIMNPRTLEPVTIKPQRSYAIAPSAAMSDALSTAFMVMEEEEIAKFCDRIGQIQALSL